MAARAASCACRMQSRMSAIRSAGVMARSAAEGSRELWFVLRSIPARKVLTAAMAPGWPPEQIFLGLGASSLRLGGVPLRAARAFAALTACASLPPIQLGLHGRVPSCTEKRLDAVPMVLP